MDWDLGTLRPARCLELSVTFHGQLAAPEPLCKVWTWWCSDQSVWFADLSPLSVSGAWWLFTSVLFLMCISLQSLDPQTDSLTHEPKHTLISSLILFLKPDTQTVIFAGFWGVTPLESVISICLVVKCANRKGINDTLRYFSGPFATS